jgi:hypothetical protein
MNRRSFLQSALAGTAAALARPGQDAGCAPQNKDHADSLLPESALDNAGTAVQLTATAAGGFQFLSFSGGLTGRDNPQSLVMSAPRTVTASFGAPAPRRVRSSTQAQLKPELFLCADNTLGGSSEFRTARQEPKPGRIPGQPAS